MLLTMVFVKGFVRVIMILYYLNILDTYFDQKLLDLFLIRFLL